MESVTVEKQEWTILSLLNWSTNHLTEKGFESPRLNAELLLCHTLACDRMDLYTHFDKPLTADERGRFKSFLKRRLAHEPVQYILGESEFMGLTFAVDCRVLIPRPETEILVEQVINTAKAITANNILDIGTGSGNISISLAKFLDTVQIDTIDISEDALDVARSNAAVHTVENRIRLIKGDIHEWPGILQNQQYDIIVSNPPYISESEFELLDDEIKKYEPVIATTDRSDGLTFYRIIVDASKTLLRNNGWVFVEVAYNQGQDVAQLFHSAGFRNIETIRDYSGNERVVKAQRA